MTYCTNCRIDLGQSHRSVLKDGKLEPVCSEECARELRARELAEQDRKLEKGA